MATIIWRGPEREFPAFGRVVRAGETVEVADEQADALVRAGLAERPKPKTQEKGSDG